MFNTFETHSSLMKKVFENRCTDITSSDIVLTALVAHHDFGKDFFHKILNKSILKPGTIPPEQAALN